MGLNFVTISFDSSYVKNQFLGPFSFSGSFSLQLPPEERCYVMGSRVGGSNSIPKTVLAQEGARQNVLNPKP